MQCEAISKNLRQDERVLAQFSYFEICAENEQECEQLAAYLTEHKEVHGRSETLPTINEIVSAAQRFFSIQLKSETLQQISYYGACSLSSYRRSQHACTLPFRVESVRYALRIE